MWKVGGTAKREAPQIVLARRPSGRVADFYGHLLAQSRQGSLDFFCLRSMFGIEHTADHSLVDPKAARQFGVVDLLVAHQLRWSPHLPRRNSVVAALSPAKRKAITKKAAKARWG